MPAGPNRADPVPRQNRVTPLGELIADPARGLVYGNRGCLHDGAGRIRRRYNGKRWIACRLSFRGWHRQPLMQPGRFTELFFLDEATAFAAGHRPCALCRREDYDRFVEAWRRIHPDTRARMRSMRSSIANGSTPGRARISRTTRSWTSCRTVRSCCTAASHGGARCPPAALRRRPATATPSSERQGRERRRSRRPRRSRSCAPTGHRWSRSCTVGLRLTERLTGKASPPGRCRRSGKGYRPLKARRPSTRQAPREVGTMGVLLMILGSRRPV